MNTNDIVNQTLQQIEPGSFRHEVLQTSMQFKANWIEYGKLLTKVASDKKFEEWGYRSFEEYCQVEARIKKSTAMKLTNAWFFLSQQEPELVNENQNLPDLETVNILQKAKETEGWTPEMYGALRESALEKQQSSSTLARKFKEMNDALKDEDEKKPIDKTRNLAVKLKKDLAKLMAPEKFQGYLDEIETFLQIPDKES